MSDHIDARIAATAARQFGYIDRRQLVGLGASRRQIETRLGNGLLFLAHPAVYRVAAVAPSPRGDLMAGALATNGVVSHRSAAWLLGLWTKVPARVELTLPRPLGWRSDLVTHRLTDLRPHNITSVEGIPCTDAARLLVDLGAVCRPSTVEKMFHKVLHEKRADFDTIVSRFFQVARRGRAGCGVLRPILEIHDPAIAPAESDLEVEMILVLRRHGLPEPVRQHKLELAGRRLRLDLAYPELKIAMEGDGFGIHTERGAFENDRARQNLLVLNGWLVLRSTWRMLIHTPWQVAKDVFDARTLRRTG